MDYDRFEDALRTRALQISHNNDPYPYMAGYLLSYVKEGRYNFTNSIKYLEEAICEHVPRDQDEQKLVDLMWQHEPIKQPLD